jgi:DNA-binding IclR family transcriptional regulator
MDTSNNNALAILKLLRKAADQNGRAEIDLNEISRATALSSDDVQESLRDLEYEGCLKLEIAVVLGDDWR